MDDMTPQADENEPSDAEVQKMIRDYEQKYTRDGRAMPSLEDILNDDDLPPAYEGRPRTEDFARERLSTPTEKAKRDWVFTAPGPRKSRRVATTPQERQWATIAHASAILTLLAGLSSFGFLSLLTLFIPLGIYLHWRQKSEYVAFQALQAFTLQVLGTVGWAALLVVGSVAFVLTSIALVLTIVGALLLIILVPLFVLLVLLSFALPIGMVVYSIIAALQTNQGADYRLPRIGRWVDRQLHSGFLAES